MRDTDDERPRGLTRDVMAMTTFRAFQYALDHEKKGWEQLSEDHQFGWLAVAELGLFLEDTGMEDEPARKVAEKFFHTWFAVALQTNSKDADFEGLPLPAQVAWEAAARHLGYVLSLDREDDHEAWVALEPNWKVWAQEKLVALDQKKLPPEPIPYTEPKGEITDEGPSAGLQAAGGSPEPGRAVVRAKRRKAVRRKGAGSRP